MTFAPIGMVRRYERSRLYLTHGFEVPVIVVFTKFDQFLRNVRMHMVDFPDEVQGKNVSEVVEKKFQDHYLCSLGPGVRFVRLESGFGVNSMPE